MFLFRTVLRDDGVTVSGHSFTSVAAVRKYD